MTFETLKAITENPSLSQADRDAAREELDRLECPETGREGTARHPLEPELLQSAYCSRLEDVSYGHIHKFCSERGWSPEARSLYFEHWLPAYSAKTPWGRHQLATVVDYLSRGGPSPDPELNAAIDAWRVLQEVRRRFNAEPEFAALFTPEEIAELRLGTEE